MKNTAIQRKNGWIFMKMIGIIFSNIYDAALGDLTKHRTLASLPFGGRYRLIDFVLSNMANSNIENVGIITKTNYQSPYPISFLWNRCD